MAETSKQNETSWHSLSTDEVLSTLGSNAVHGLSHNDAKERLARYGTNTLPEPKRRSLLSIFFHQFLSPLIYLLLTAATIAFFIGAPKDAIVILVIVLLNAIIGAFQEGRAEQSLVALRRLSKLKARVLRSGQELLIEASEIVPGDILILNSGDAVPADARLIDASAMSVAEAALTGESLPVVKSITPLPLDTLLTDRHNM
ncbi:MAG: haloacid dehalogenase, partial [Alphaproteobacteria bacterium]